MLALAKFKSTAGMRHSHARGCHTWEARETESREGSGKNNARKCNNKPERLFAVKADVEEELAPQLHADHGDLLNLRCLLETRSGGKSLSLCVTA